MQTCVWQYISSGCSATPQWHCVIYRPNIKHDSILNQNYATGKHKNVPV